MHGETDMGRDMNREGTQFPNVGNGTWKQAWPDKNEERHADRNATSTGALDHHTGRLWLVCHILLASISVHLT